MAPLADSSTETGRWDLSIEWIIGLLIIAWIVFWEVGPIPFEAAVMGVLFHIAMLAVLIYSEVRSDG